MSSKSKSTPMSTTTTAAPACLASTFIPAPPEMKFITIWRVTSFGNAETPSSATPWSPANVNMVFLSRVGRSSPVMATMRLANSSSLPMLSLGFVSISRRA